MTRWRAKPTIHMLRCFPLLLLVPVCLFLYAFKAYPLASDVQRSTNRHCPQCATNRALLPASVKLLPEEEKYMWYAPHSGFSNQVGELRNALRIAGLLNRTLIIPPVTDHHALSLGSCPKYRVVDPPVLRLEALSHISQLISESRYFSIADIVNISAVSPSIVKTIDFRIFSLLWCGADIGAGCAGPLCHQLVGSIQTWGSLKGCANLLSQFQPEPDCCVYGVSDSCATTVWTYRDQSIVAKDQQVFRRSLLSSNVYNLSASIRLKPKKHFGQRKPLDIYETLGRYTKAGKATVLAFGSLFSSQYQGAELHVDLSYPSGNTKMDKLLRETEFFPFTNDILQAGKRYVKQTIKQPFFCAQLRLLDGQFKNHWEKTFSTLKLKLEPLYSELKGREKIAVFIMTDLPRTNWTSTYLGELAANSRYNLYHIDLEDAVIGETAKKLLVNEYGIKSGFLPGLLGTGKSVGWELRDLTDILLFIEEVVCACASLGFQGTVGSTVTDSISAMRNRSVCPINFS